MLMIDDDGSAEMLYGFWPFLKRGLFFFLPLWVFVMAMSIGLPIILSAIIAGASVSIVSIIENKKFMKQN
jgi:TRAP-type uncharacterized transport system fused permease subunit